MKDNVHHLNCAILVFPFEQLWDVFGPWLCCRGSVAMAFSPAVGAGSSWGGWPGQKEGQRTRSSVEEGREAGHPRMIDSSVSCVRTGASVLQPDGVKKESKTISTHTQSNLPLQ